MVLLGRILENESLEIAAITEKKEVLYENRKFIERVVTIEEQVSKLTQSGWKPVDEQDETAVANHTENEKVIPVPHDLGDRITYTYKKEIDKDRIARKIEQLKKDVAATDYQVRKCYECFLVDKPLPYDVEAIHSEAEAIRVKIQALEALL